MTTATRSFNLGSVSTGTLRPEDLISAFVATLKDTVTFGSTAPDSKYDSLIAEADAITDYDSEEIEWILDELIDALNEYAPPFVHFGAHEGDGADFGWWPDIDALNEARRGAVKVGDYELLPDEGILVQVSDHGNVSLYEVAAGHEIWSTV